MRGKTTCHARPGRRHAAWAALLITALAASAGPALGAERDPARVEADRLASTAAARADTPGAAVDLIRLHTLADWLPDGEAEGALRRATEDGAPLVRAVAWWLVRGLARDRLDRAVMDEAVEALGLLTAVSMRPGQAPHPTADLDPERFRPYPPAAGAGVIWLDAYLRPAREVAATVVGRLVSEDGGPAVLRLGYDDAVTVWLNGDEVYASPATHPAWLDQAAVPIRLRAGDNRLVIEVRQRSGAWRVMMRVTDDTGEPLPVEMHPDPWGPVPEPAPTPDDEADEGAGGTETGEDEDPGPAHLWTALFAAADADPPVAVDLRDMADYARITGLPDPDQALPRVAVEGVWPDDPGARSLRTWVRLMPEGERNRVRGTHPIIRPIPRADHWSDLRLETSAAWRHYYARRHGAALTAVRRLLERVPDDLPARRLEAVIHQDLGLVHTAVALLARARTRWPERPALRRAHVSALQVGGRVTELEDELVRWMESGAGPDARYQLATLHAARGEVDAAVELLDGVAAARPELWTYGMEAAEMLWGGGREAEAIARWQALADERPGDETVVERLVRAHVARGDADAARAVLAAGRAAHPAADGFEALEARLDAARLRPRLGPAMDALAAVPPVAAPMQVLYHHARAEVGADGRAERRIRRVMRINTAEGARRYGTVELSYVPSTQRVEVEQARLLRAGAPAISPRRSDRDLSDPAWRLYYDLRAEVLVFPKVQPGDVIEVAWRLVDTDLDPAFPGYYGEMAWLQEVAPRARSVVEIGGALAPELATVLDAKGLTVAETGVDGWRRFEAHDVPGLPLEPNMPGASTMRAHVHVSSIAEWSKVDRRYLALLDDRDQAALAGQAAEWAGDATDPAEVMDRLYAGVADKIRYVGLEFGVHSFKPEDPAVTLARAFGDCKDKATLLIALARTRGIDGKLVLVRTRRSGAVGAEPASLAVFDHAIVYVPALDRFYDPTVDRNDPGVLPPSDQGAFAFVVGHDTAPRIIPPQPAELNRDDWTLALEMDTDGRARGTARWQTGGHPATVARRALDGAVDVAEVAQSALGQRFPGARLTDPQVTGVAPAFDPVAVEAAVELPPLHAIDGGFDLTVGGAPWQLVGQLAQAATRKTPLHVTYRHLRRVGWRLTAPAGWRITAPESRRIDSPFGAMELAVRPDGPRAVEVSVTLTVRAFEVSPTDYPAFRAWLAEVDDLLGQTVEVRR